MPDNQNEIEDRIRQLNHIISEMRITLGQAEDTRDYYANTPQSGAANAGEDFEKTIRNFPQEIRQREIELRDLERRLQTLTRRASEPDVPPTLRQPPSTSVPPPLPATAAQSTLTTAAETTNNDSPQDALPEDGQPFFGSHTR